MTFSRNVTNLTPERGENMEIKVQNNNVEKALRDFKQRLTKSGLMREMRARRFYEKPSEKRNRKKKEAERKRKKAKTQRFERLR